MDAETKLQARLSAVEPSLGHPGRPTGGEADQIAQATMRNRVVDCAIPRFEPESVRWEEGVAPLARESRHGIDVLER
jgi:hypothetical protein